MAFDGTEGVEAAPSVSMQQQSVTLPMLVASLKGTDSGK